MRVTTNTSGSIVAQSGHFPYGENWYESGGTNKLKFTRSARPRRRTRSGQASYERDAESGNDYPSAALGAGAIFRTHISRLGRFNRPGSIADPQSLNRFAYVRNNPINFVDLLGQRIQTGTNASTHGAGNWLTRLV